MQRRNQIILAFLLLIACGAEAAEWHELAGRERCVGGSRCGRDEVLRLEIDRIPVEAVRFLAHDDVGQAFEGRVRIRIDDQILQEMTLDRRERAYRVSGGGVVGRWLIIEPATNDEIVVGKIEVSYRQQGRVAGERRGWEDDRRSNLNENDRSVRSFRYDEEQGGWQSDERTDRRGRYGSVEGGRRRSSSQSSGPRVRSWQGAGSDTRIAFLEEVGCLGRDRCNNTAITVHFRRAARVGEIRFFAHDNLGNSKRGRLRVKLDGEVLVDDLDIPTAGRVFKLHGRGRLARELTFEPVTYEEILVKDLTVLEAPEERRPGRETEPLGSKSYRPSSRLAGGVCLGGKLCDDRWELEIPTRNDVSALRFFGHANLGRGYGILQVKTNDGDMLRELEIDRGGGFYEVEVPTEAFGLVLNVVQGDLIIEELELRTADGWERLRADSEE